MQYTSSMAMPDISVHIKDLITAYESMPPSERRDLVIQALKQAYGYAVADSLKT